MKCLGIPLMRRFLKNEGGQTAVIVMLTAGTMMALSGATVESGHIYYAYQQLVASTNAAALAGAQAMPNTTQAASNVTLYSAQSGQLNANSFLQNVAATPTFVSSSGVNSSFNVACETATGASGGYNAVSVTQTAKVNLWFGGLIGIRSMNMSATAEAAMRGGTNTPWNIAVILDATPSMDYQDNGVQCSGTQLSCAKEGIRTLLQDLYPCGLNQTCTSSGSTAVDSVTFFVFPAVTSTSASKDYSCSGSPTTVAYTFPNLPSTTSLPNGDTYQTLTWANDYKSTDTATSLNTSSDEVIAAGGKSRCTGISTRNEWTYYPQAIYAAQAALVTEQAANPGSKNAIILLGDGDLNATASNAYTTGGGLNSSPIALIATEGTLNGTGTSSSNPAGTTNGVCHGYNCPAYPSALGQCGQAVLAAQAAANAGTNFYTIGYGSLTTGSCVTDKTYSTSVTTNGGTWGPGKQACDALAAMASAGVNFYSDDGQGCEATAPSNQSITKLTAIFHAITNNLTTPRLIPSGT